MRASMKFAAVALTLPGITGPVAARDLIRVNLRNSTSGMLLSGVTTTPYCEPAGACNFPQIAPGTTGVITQQASEKTFIRSIIVRYGYWDSSAAKQKNCQLSVSWHGPSTTTSGTACDDVGPRATFIPIEGSPGCSTPVVHPDRAQCNAVIDVEMRR